jgi:transposase
LLVDGRGTLRYRAQRSHVHDQTDAGRAEWATLKDKLQTIGWIWQCGDEGRNRRFLSGVYYLLRTGLPWADLPVEFGNSDAVRKRFRRWCKAGIWQRLLEGTICKAHRSATGARGGAAEDIGRSRGGLTTKIGASVCAKTQKIVRVILAPGQRNDCVLAAQMLGQAEAITVIADKAFDTDPVRNELAARGCTAVIPSKDNRRQPKKLNKAAYRQRHGIENVFSRVKDLVRITLRRDTTSISYLGFIHLACAILNIRRDNFLAREG